MEISKLTFICTEIYFNISTVFVTFVLKVCWYGFMPCVFVCVTAGDGKEVSPPGEGEEESSDSHAAKSSIKPQQTRVQRVMTHRHGQPCTPHTHTHTHRDTQTETETNTHTQLELNLSLSPCC